MSPWRVFSQKGLKTGISSSPQHRGLSILGSQAIDPEKLKEDFECCCDPINNLVVAIEYNWDNTGKRDLDTGTEVFGQVAGYACGSNLPRWIIWKGDTIQRDTKEEVYVYIGRALKEGLWPEDEESIIIYLYAGWYIPAGGSGPATVYVYTAREKENTDEIDSSLREQTQQSKTINPGRQSGCARGEGGEKVGSVTIYRDATFTLH